MQRPSKVLRCRTPVIALSEMPEFDWLKQCKQLMEVHELPAPPAMRDLGTNTRERIEEVGNVLSAFVDGGSRIIEGGLVLRSHAEAEMHGAEEPVVRESRQVFLALVVIAFQPRYRNRLLQRFGRTCERCVYSSNEGCPSKRIQ